LGIYKKSVSQMMTCDLPGFERKSIAMMIVFTTDVWEKSGIMGYWNLCFSYTEIIL
jgi:hypothetical protein